MINPVSFIRAAAEPIPTPPPFKHKLCYACLCSCLLLPVHAAAEDYFDPAFLKMLGEEDSVDLSIFAKPGSIAEGIYVTTVMVNQNSLGQYTFEYKKNSKGVISPLLTVADLANFGVNVKQVDALKTLAPETVIDDIGALIPDATSTLNLTQLQLDISVPQVAMSQKMRGWADPSLWDDGITAMMTNYSVSAGQTKNTPKYGRNNTTKNVFVNFRSRLNVGAWRLYNNYNYAYTDNGNNASNQNRSNHQFANTFLTRDIIPLRSTFSLGEISTGSDVFDSFPAKGTALTSSEDMLPSQLRGYSPVISGIANSNARVTVRQNGNIVYETYVAPGEFRINDLQQAGLSGDYNVTVTEANGTERQFIVPYSSLPNMLRPGGWKYQVAGGRYDGGYTDGSRQEQFILATGAYGFPQNFTLYGGVLAAKDYYSLSSGLGISIGEFGAVSADVSFSSAKLADNNRTTGQSYRIRYSKSMLQTGTTVDLTALRYSTEGYYSFSEFNAQGYNLKNGVNALMIERRRNSFQTQLSQNFGQYGSFSLSANRDDYWGSDRTNTGLSMSYSNSFKAFNVSLSYNINRMKSPNGDWPENRQLMLSVNVPLSGLLNSSNVGATYLTSSISHDNTGKTQSSIGASGNLAGNSNLSYGLSQSWGNQNQVSQSNANLGYYGSKGGINIGYGYSRDNQSMNMSANGGAILHAGGLTFSQNIGDSAALVHLPQGAGTKLTNSDSTVDWNGYAVVPSLSNYNQNNIGLNPATLPDHVDVLRSNQNIYPTRGAIIGVTFTPRIGYQVLVDLQRDAGTVPFGAIATLVTTDTVQDTTATMPSSSPSINGIVGDGGQVYMTGMPEQGQLQVTWGDKATQQCIADIDLSSLGDMTSGGGAIRQITVPCR